MYLIPNMFLKDNKYGIWLCGNMVVLLFCGNDLTPYYLSTLLLNCLPAHVPFCSLKYVNSNPVI